MTDRILPVVHFPGNDSTGLESGAFGWRAATIDERIFNWPRGDATGASCWRAEVWSHLGFDGDEAKLTERLASVGLERTGISALAAERADSESAEPAWWPTFQWLLASLLRSAKAEEATRFSDPLHPLPFEHCFFSLVADASTRTTLARRSSILDARSIASFERMLLKRLTRLSQSVLFEQFSLYRLIESPAARIPRPDAQDANSSTLYQQFITVLQHGEWLELFTNRPVMARLFSTVVNHWIESVDELLDRLERDATEIAHTLLSVPDFPKVIEVTSGYSDSHHRGRSVLRVTLQDGHQLAYKPKCLDLDLALSRLLQCLARAGAPPNCRVPPTLSRDCYGWSLWISPHRCHTRVESALFFQKSGAMLALLSCLGGSDFHAENVIAHGTDPIPIDVETLFQPWVPSVAAAARQEDATGAAVRMLKQSVFATYYLPTWVVLANEVPVKSGGLNPYYVVCPEYVKFQGTNTDSMALADSAPDVKPSANLPLLDGQFCRVADFVAEFETGFRSMYRFLLAHRADLLATDGWLAEFRRQSIRVVLRPTEFYQMLLEQSLRNENLSNGFDWSVRFEFLNRCYTARSAEGAERWAVQKAERASLANLDVPYFSAPADGTELHLPDGEVVPGFFSASGWEQQRSYVRQMSEAHLEKQCSYIRWSCAEEPRDAEESVPPVLRSGTYREASLSREDLLATAIGLADHLRQEAIVQADTATWIGCVQFSHSGVARLEAVGPNLYSGAVGIATFLAALAQETQREEYRRLAFQAVQGVLNETTDFVAARSLGPGGGSGLGSIIYGLLVAGRLLEWPELLDHAANLAALLDEKMARADRALDAVLGSAGALLALLQLDAALGGDRFLPQATLFGEYLVAQQRWANTGAAWPTVDGVLLAGFSHGAAGIMLALGRLHHRTGENRFRVAVEEGWRYESSLFCPRVRMWPDLRKEAGPALSYGCQWCHGATGIGLARLGLRGLINEEDRQSDIAAAVSAARQPQHLPTDDVCCGNFGRVELLLEAASIERNDALTAEAHALASNLVARSRLTGGFRYKTGTHRQNPSFFTGVAGIGYQLLRLAGKHPVPSILTWG